MYVRNVAVAMQHRYDQSVVMTLLCSSSSSLAWFSCSRHVGGVFGLQQHTVRSNFGRKLATHMCKMVVSASVRTCC
jgi:hypothetical protein